MPALALPGITLVVSPLIALMKDQIDALAARGIAAQRLDSSLDADGYRAVMQRLRSGELRLLYVAPERFNNERFRQTLAHSRVSLFAVDEAHCISEWGHNFRPDYLKLAGFARAAKAERLLALTAIATPKVLDDICRVFEIDAECAVRTDFYRPNLRLLFTPVTPEQRDRDLPARLGERPAGPAIVYVTLQRTAERVAQQLADAGHPARAYHAGMDSERRAAVQEWFLGSGDGIVVATIAFGMGIDKADIRYVYHYNLEDLAAKLHERALRREENELARLRQVLELIEADGCQVAMLSAHFGERCEPCGHCSWCLDGGQPARLPARGETGIDPAVWSEAAALRREHPEVLGHARVMARFLCGVPSPSLSKAKLTGHALFGRLAQVPFATVKERAETTA